MEDYIRSLQPIDDCHICHEPFGAGHQPTVLACKHIFGHGCILSWLQDGEGNTNSCPICRHMLFEDASGLSNQDLWARLCQAPLAKIRKFVELVRDGARRFMDRYLRGNVCYAVHEIIRPALWIVASRQPYDPFLKCHMRLGTYTSQQAEGLAIPFYRLLRLMDIAYAAVESHIVTRPSFNDLLWKANAYIPYNAEIISWEQLTAISTRLDGQDMPLLHLFSALISQDIEQHAKTTPIPKRRHEKMNLVVARYCNKIGMSFDGKPSNEFKDKLAIVYEELRRHQEEYGRMSLRGDTGEKHIVKGLWQTASWVVQRVIAR
jgi:hypothetical protein